MTMTRPGGLLAGAAVLLLAGCAGGAAGTQTASIQPVQAGDADMSCAQISTEIAEMNEVLGLAEDDMRSLQAMGLAQDAVVNAALYSGGMAAAGSALPFVGTALNLASGVQNMSRQQKQKVAEQAVDRRNVLTGMYTGKGCATAA